MEETITCPYFGGTYDFLVEINGRNWLIDFKTSNHIGYKYNCLFFVNIREPKGIESFSQLVMENGYEKPFKILIVIFIT